MSAVTLFPTGAEYSQKHDLYEYRLDSRDARCLEHGWGRLGLLGAALPAFTRRIPFFIPWDRSARRLPRYPLDQTNKPCRVEDPDLPSLEIQPAYREPQAPPQPASPEVND